MTLGTVPNPEGLGKPPIDELMEHADSKYALAMFAAKRARQINSYLNQERQGIEIQSFGPLVRFDDSDKPLSLALDEINKGLLEEKLGEDEPLVTQLQPTEKIKAGERRISMTDVVSDIDGLHVEDFDSYREAPDDGDDSDDLDEYGAIEENALNFDNEDREGDFDESE